MATMNILVNNALKVTPFVIAEDDNSVQTYKTIRVPIPAGVTSLYIEEVYSPGAVGGTSQTYTISTQTDITLTLEGVIDEGVPANNTVFHSAYLFVSLDASSGAFYSTGITRTHTGTYI